MRVVGIGATGEICHHGHSTVCNNADTRFDADRANKAGDAAQRFFDFVFAGEAEGADACQFAGLDFVEFVIAA